MSEIEYYKKKVYYGTGPEMVKKIDELSEMIRTLLAEPRRSTKLISEKSDQFEPMTMTVTKGQVLGALKLIKRGSYGASSAVAAGFLARRKSIRLSQG